MCYPAAVGIALIAAGLAMLAYPYALAQNGWVGIAIFCSLAAATRYTAGIIARSIDTCGGPRKCGTYADLGYAAFGLPGASLITTCFFMELIGAACAGYVVVFADNVHVLNVHHTVAFYAVIAVLVVLPTTWFRDLSYLSAVSFIGVLSACVLTVVVLYSGFHIRSGPGSLHEPQATAALHISNVPYTLGVWMAGFAGHAVVPQLYCSMAEPDRFGTVLNISYAAVIPLYLLVAVSAYLMYGEGVATQVTLSLPDGIVTEICLYMIVLNCVCKFALTLAPVSEVVEGVIDQLRSGSGPPQAMPPTWEEDELSLNTLAQGSPSFDFQANDAESVALSGWDTPLLSPRSAFQLPSRSPLAPNKDGAGATSTKLRMWLRMVCIRALLCGVILGVAILVPDFDRLLSFCGSLLSFTVSIAFPPLAYIKLHPHISKCAKAGNWALGITGALLAAVGTVASVMQ